MHRTWIEVEERALTHNIHQLRGLLAAGSRFCAVVKANAYGHGLEQTVQIAARAGVDAFAVDHVDEGLQVRAIHPSAMILVLGYTLHSRYQDALQGQLDLTVYDADSLKSLEAVAARSATTARIHLKMETGTGRQGILPGDLALLLSHIASSPHLEVAGVSTHFANIEDTTDTTFATQQLARFHTAVNTVLAAGFTPTHIHCACSAALILYPDTHGTLVRGGISLYGIWPSNATEKTARRHRVDCDLIPVLSWKTRIAQVKAFPAGTPIGYGLTEVLKRNSRLAVLPVGYADGFDRGLSSVGEVIISGTRCKVVGRICMNMMMVDVSHVANAAPEMEVVLLGRSGRHEQTAQDIAERIGTIPYEILARINPTIPRVIV